MSAPIQPPDCNRRDSRATAQSRLAADDASVERAAFFAEAFYIQAERFARVLGGLVERVALGVQPGQVGGVDVVATFLLGLEDELDLGDIRHVSRIPSPMAGAVGVVTESPEGAQVSGRRRHSLLYELYLGAPVWRARWWWFVTSNRRCAHCRRQARGPPRARQFVEGA